MFEIEVRDTRRKLEDPESCKVTTKQILSTLNQQKPRKQEYYNDNNNILFLNIQYYYHFAEIFIFFCTFLLLRCTYTSLVFPQQENSQCKFWMHEIIISIM